MSERLVDDVLSVACAEQSFRRLELLACRPGLGVRNRQILRSSSSSSSDHLNRYADVAVLLGYYY